MSDSFDHLIPDWATEFPYAITVSDKQAIIIYMNDKSGQTFINSGGQDLIGKSLYDCHSPASAGIIRELLATGRSNIYTIEKNGVKKLICQSPWYTQGELSGLVEISILLPDPMQHFIRQ
jgi:transcriptional regulator with PAS, ATPase and Fis domain